jgi:hypothetical protein
MERNGTANSNSTAGAHISPDTTIMPAIVNRSNGATVVCSRSISQALSTPLRGPRTKTQPMALMISGTASATNADRYASPLNGALVRSTSQASRPPKAMPSRELPSAYKSEFLSSGSRSAD